MNPPIGTDLGSATVTLLLVAAVAGGIYTAQHFLERKQRRKSVPLILKALAATRQPPKHAAPKLTRRERRILRHLKRHQKRSTRFIQWPRTDADTIAETKSDAYWTAMSQAQNRKTK